MGPKLESLEKALQAADMLRSDLCKAFTAADPVLRLIIRPQARAAAEIYDALISAVRVLREMDGVK